MIRKPSQKSTAGVQGTGHKCGIVRTFDREVMRVGELRAERKIFTGGWGSPPLDKTTMGKLDHWHGKLKKMVIGGRAIRSLPQRLNLGTPYVFYIRNYKRLAWRGGAHL